MKTRNISHLINFQLVRNGVAPVICLFLRQKRRKKGALISWNMLELPDNWKEVKLIKNC